MGRMYTMCVVYVVCVYVRCTVCVGFMFIHVPTVCVCGVCLCMCTVCGVCGMSLYTCISTVCVWYVSMGIVCSVSVRDGCM